MAPHTNGLQYCFGIGAGFDPFFAAVPFAHSLITVPVNSCWLLSVKHTTPGCESSPELSLYQSEPLSSVEA